MKKRLFTGIVVLGFAIIFLAMNYLPMFETANPQEFTLLETSSAKAATLKTGPLDGIKIVLDAGHGGYDGGAVGQNETLEKDITLRTVSVLKERLQDQGATVLVTREQDEFVSLRSRTQVARTYRADLFISVHADGFENPEAKGMTTYHYNEQDKDLAEAIHSHIFKEDIVTENRGTAFGNYQVLRDTDVPAVLLELGYITNAEDEQMLKDGNFQATVSEQVVEGVMQYVHQQAAIDDGYIVEVDGPSIAK